MHPSYDGVKFYGLADLSTGWEYEKTVKVLELYESDRTEYQINEILELYNIQKMLEAGCDLPDGDNVLFARYIDNIPELKKTIAIFFSKIDGFSVSLMYDEVAVSYVSDFWELFEHYKLYNRISADCFLKWINDADLGLHNILRHKNIVAAFDKQLAAYMRSSEDTPEILSATFLESSKTQYFIPKDLNPSEFDGILTRYVKTDSASPRIMQLIFDAQSTKECPISDKLRLLAKRNYQRFWQERAISGNGIKYGISVGFREQDEIASEETSKGDYRAYFDVKWLRSNLDFPTILNNFIYVFEMADRVGRSLLVSVKSKLSAFEEVFEVRGTRFYLTGNHFRISDMVSKAEIALYADLLKAHGISLERVIKWFFEEYLLQEFGADGFSFNESSDSGKTVEKCRNLAAEMDGTLKQFRMYVCDGVIDRELYEMSSGHTVFSDIPGFVAGKYAYASSDRTRNQMFMLFSNQSILGYIEKTKERYETLYDLLSHEIIELSDFAPFQQGAIRYLIDAGCLNETESGVIRLSNPRAQILRDLYSHDVICTHRIESWEEEIKRMVQNGDLRLGSTLFSEPECDYMNFMLNKSEFSNGRDLRNKYMHSTNNLDENVQQNDYFDLLKIMIMIIIKINDDFCLRDRLADKLTHEIR